MEWQNEPNEKVFESNNFNCHIKRHPSMLHLCGYVALPKSHKLYGKGYNELYDMQIDIRVHGGLTYASQEGEEWVFGFDCAHSGDVVPAMLQYGHEDGVYRNMEYVEQETKELAEQLANL